MLPRSGEESVVWCDVYINEVLQQLSVGARVGDDVY